MTSIEWVTLDPAEYEHVDAVEVYGVVVSGRPEFLLVRDGRDDAALWSSYVVLHQDTEGFGGLENLDGHSSLSEGKAALEADVRAFLASP